MFLNTAKVEWIKGEPRDMMLLSDLRYVDTDGFIWTAEEGAIINGASIPRVLWSVMGSPFVGFYREPSAMHDAYYKSRIMDKYDVDKMFYEAMQENGVSHIKADLMYQAVKMTGADWEEYDNRNEEEDDDEY